MSSSQAPPSREVLLQRASRTWRPHSTCLRRWEEATTSRNAPSALPKTKHNEETRDNFNGDSRGLDLFKTHPLNRIDNHVSGMSRVNGLLGWETTREEGARLRITR